MKSLIVASYLFGVFSCFAQSYPAYVQEPNLLFVDMVSVRNNELTSLSTKVSYLSGFRMDLPRDYRMGLSAIIYYENDAPEDGRSSYNLNLFIGRRYNLIEGKRSSLYMAGDLGMGRSAGYINKTSFYQRQLSDYLQGVISMGFRLPIGWKFYVSAETGFGVSLAVSDKHTFDRASDQLMKRTSNKVETGVNPFPLRALSVGWIL